MENETLQVLESVCKAAGKKVCWLPSMSRTEAALYIKDSKYKKTLYHGTSKTASIKIKKEGFWTSPYGVFGRGIYATPDKEYARIFGSTMLETNVDVRKLKRYTSLKKYMKDLKKVSASSEPERIKKFFENIRKKYDGVFLEETPHGRSEFITFNSKNITVLK